VKLACNGAFLRFGAHVVDLHSAPMLENHHFRLSLTVSKQTLSVRWNLCSASGFGALHGWKPVPHQDKISVSNRTS